MIFWSHHCFFSFNFVLLLNFGSLMHLFILSQFLFSFLKLVIWVLNPHIHDLSIGFKFLMINDVQSPLREVSSSIRLLIQMIRMKSSIHLSDLSFSCYNSLFMQCVSLTVLIEVLSFITSRGKHLECLFIWLVTLSSILPKSLDNWHGVNDLISLVYRIIIVAEICSWFKLINWLRFDNLCVLQGLNYFWVCSLLILVNVVKCGLMLVSFLK